jgi:hypothetical protein
MGRGRKKSLNRHDNENLKRPEVTGVMQSRKKRFNECECERCSRSGVRGSQVWRMRRCVRAKIVVNGDRLIEMKGAKKEKKGEIEVHHFRFLVSTRFNRSKGEEVSVIVDESLERA